MTVSKIKYYLLFLVVFVVLTRLSAIAQPQLQRMEIEPLNRAVFYFSELPKFFTTELSEDKKKIIIKINKASVIDSAREFHSNGIINDIYVHINKNNIEIQLILSEKRGYTAFQSYYTKALYIEVFSWDKLDKAEDSYRSGLLALEYGLKKSAVQNFTDAVKAGNSDASAVMGFLDFQDGKIIDALNNFAVSFKAKSKIPDVYASLSQIFKFRNNIPMANKFSDLFSKMTRLKTYTDLPFPVINSDDSTMVKVDSILKEISLFAQNEVQDSKKKADSIKADSIARAKQFKNIIQEPKQEEDGTFVKILKSFLPAGFGNVIGVVLLFAVVLIAVMLFAYLKWKRQQEKVIASQPKPQFKTQLKSAQNKINKATAVDAYNRSGAIVNKTIKGTDSNQTPKTTKPTPKVKSDSNEAESFEQRLEKLANIIEETNKPEPSQDENSYDSDKNLNTERNDKIPARLELAMHLQEEQKKIKQRNIASLSESYFPVDVGKLSEVAKKLGIEKDAIVTKQGINRIEQDKDKLSELTKKFSKGS